VYVPGPYRSAILGSCDIVLLASKKKKSENVELRSLRLLMEISPVRGKRRRRKSLPGRLNSLRLSGRKHQKSVLASWEVFREVYRFWIT
jgi:hypothetical protein